MQERSDDSFFAQLVLGGKSKRVDSAKFVIRRIGDRVFDGSSAAASADCRKTPKRASVSLT